MTMDVGSGRVIVVRQTCSSGRHGYFRMQFLGSAREVDGPLLMPRFRGSLFRGNSRILAGRTVEFPSAQIIENSFMASGAVVRRNSGGATPTSGVNHSTVFISFYYYAFAITGIADVISDVRVISSQLATFKIPAHRHDLAIKLGVEGVTLAIPESLDTALIPDPI